MRESGEQQYLLTLLQATAEAMGSELKPATLALIAHDLEPYSFPLVETALARCRAEISGRLTLAGILDRLQGADTRPAPNETWAMVLKARDENETVVWCHEMEMGWWASVEILRNGDKIGARMAFLEVYTRCVAGARVHKRPAQWTVSPGHDPELRRIAIERACEQGLLTDVQRLALISPVAANTVEMISNMRSVEGRRQARKLLSKLNAQQRLEARRARAEQEEKTLQNQLQREA
ncbi:MAG: hypothetical protein WBX11_00145, partial [Thiobacillaceae bacterium]